MGNPVQQGERRGQSPGVSGVSGGHDWGPVLGEPWGQLWVQDLWRASVLGGVLSSPRAEG